MLSEIQIDLQLPPAERWHFDEHQKQAALELVAMYTRDLGVSGETAELALEMGRAVTPAEYWQEIEGIAGQLGCDVAQVAVSNLYYDALKSVIGCTAFGVPTPEGPLHARNLDWWTEDQLLSRATTTVRFNGGEAGEFYVVGWPGFAGVFSAVAPGRFAVTLNAVLSGEPSQPALPIVFLLRRVLEHAHTYDEALQAFTSTPVASDSLLLLTGVTNEQIAVVERTPTRHAVRHPTDGFVSVTNDYLLVDTDTGTPTNALQATACGRRERIGRLLRADQPTTPKACLEYLSDDGVRMEITVQQMVFCAATGLRLVRTGKGSPET